MKNPTEQWAKTTDDMTEPSDVEMSTDVDRRTNESKLGTAVLNEDAMTLVQSNLLLSVTALFYLLWWIVFFRPGSTVKYPSLEHSLGNGSLVIAAVTGLLAIVFMVRGLYKTLDDQLPKFGHAAFGATMSYMAVAFCTQILLDRHVTTELSIMVVYTVLEILCLIDCSRSGLTDKTDTALTTAGLLFVTIVNIFCYCVYYFLDDTWRFIDGMIPLVLCGVFSLVSYLITSRALQ